MGAMQNFHPKGTPIFPALFFTISCGAISGFHATQAPMVSRTSTNEREGRFLFYGMMIAEGVIAMIWAGASMALFDGQTLSQMIDAGTPSSVVNQVSTMLLGNVFGTVAIIGVIVLPISSGLSAFRSLRTILADYMNIKQDSMKKILMMTIPLFVISFFLTKVDFNLIWRYFNWANQGYSRYRLADVDALPVSEKQKLLGYLIACNLHAVCLRRLYPERADRIPDGIADGHLPGRSGRNRGNPGTLLDNRREAEGSLGSGSGTAEAIICRSERFLPLTQPHPPAVAVAK